MHIILSHTNLDFDGLASMIGAKKLYPQAEIVFPAKISPEVERFLAIYKDIFPYKRGKEINWTHVSNIILVDTNTVERTGDIKSHINKNIHFIVYDHHPKSDQTVTFTEGCISSVGATITLLIEEIKTKDFHISPFEATVFALGLYSNTGSFTYKQTTARDLSAGAWCLDSGANISIVNQYKDASLKKEAQALLHNLQDEGEIHSIDGLEVFVTSHEQKEYTGHLAVITRKLLELTGTDAVFAIVKMGQKVFITARASSDRLNVLPVIKGLGGGGHTKAASAMRKTSLSEVINYITDKLYDIVTPPITALHLMSTPVRVVAPETTIEDASKMLYRYGHTGFPVIEKEKLVGIISRRDVDKALHHGLGHAPVKGYMNRNPKSIYPDESLEDIQEKMIKEQIGRLPVMEDEKLIGIVSRTDVISAMHGQYLSSNTNSRTSVPLKINLSEQMQEYLSESAYSLLLSIGQEADQLQMKAYLIGGMVRDLLLYRENEDMDIVVEGDGIVLAEHLQEKFGGSIRSHNEFRTATWKHPSNYKIDLTSARTEYYDFPAALPKVELSTIKEDLFRRDFSINAMGICLHKGEFGELIDYFYGYQDLTQKKIKVLYNLSFVEDPTRILRGLRFESRFQFQMNSQTESLAKESANNLLSVSKPRISNELSRLFYEESSLNGLKRMEDLGLLPFLLKNRVDPALSTRRSRALSQMVDTLRENNVKPNRCIWISFLLAYSPIEEDDWSEIEAYSLSKQDLKLVQDIQKLIQEQEKNTIPEKLLSLGELHDIFSEASLEALITFFAFKSDPKFTLITEYLLAREKLVPIVTGEDLIELGLTPGPKFRDLLLEVEKKQLNNPDITKVEILKYIKLKYAVKKRQEHN